MEVNFDSDTTEEGIKVVIGFSVESIGVNFHAYKDKSNKFKITACMTKLLCENNDQNCFLACVIIASME